MPKPCKVEGCENLSDSYGWCKTHAMRWRRHGDPLFRTRPQNRGLQKCSVRWCQQPHDCLGYCSSHAKRFRAYGDPLATARTDLQDRNAKCKVRGCTREIGDGSNGMCRPHYRKTRHAARPEHYKAKVNARRRRMRHATPPWADKQAIFRIYRECPKGFEVDHFIPLFGEFVSGLHVHINLQYLPMRRNRQKGRLHPEGFFSARGHKARD